MQFFKDIKPSNAEYPNNGLYSSLRSGQKDRQDLSKYFDRLLFEIYLHTDWKGTVIDCNKAFISDVIASNIQQLYEKEFLTNRIVQENLNCCRDIMYNLGY